MLGILILDVLLLIVVTVAVLSAWSFWVYLLLGSRKESLEQGVVSVFCFIASVTLTFFILGVASLLYPLVGVVINLAIPLILLILKGFKKKDFHNWLQFLQPEWKGWISRTFPTITLRIILILAAGFWLWIGLMNVLFPSINLLDYLSTHQMIAHAYQSSSLEIFPFFTSALDYRYHPSNPMLLSLWEQNITGNSRLLELSGWLCLPVLSVTIYLLLRKLEVKKTAAQLTGLLIFFIPLVALQARTSGFFIYQLLMLAGFFYFLLSTIDTGKQERNPQSEKRLRLMLSGSSLGLLLGSGYEMVVYLIPILLFLISVYLVKRVHFLQLIKHLGIYLLLIVIFGGGWYLRNGLETGNPFHPYDDGIGIWTADSYSESYAELRSQEGELFHHFGNRQYNNELSRLWFNLSEQSATNNYFYSADSIYTGLGPLGMILGIPALIFLLFYCIKHKRYICLLTALALVLLHIVNPGSWNLSYSFYLVLLLVISLGVMLSNLRLAWLSRLLRVMLVGIVGYSVLMLIPLQNLTPQIIAAAILPQIHSPGVTSYGDGIWLQEITAGLRQPETTWFVKHDLGYALLNPDYSNRVIYQNCESHEEWMAYLDNQQVDFVVIKVPDYVNYLTADLVPSTSLIPQELQWMQSNPQLFRQIVCQANPLQQGEQREIVYVFRYQPNKEQVASVVLDEKGPYIYQPDIILLGYQVLRSGYGQYQLELELMLANPILDNPGIIVRAVPFAEQQFISSLELMIYQKFGIKTIPAQPRAYYQLGILPVEPMKAWEVQQPYLETITLPLPTGRYRLEIGIFSKQAGILLPQVRTVINSPSEIGELFKLMGTDQEYLKTEWFEVE